jgi:hypothetical protein
MGDICAVKRRRVGRCCRRMTSGTKFYKIKLINKLLDHTHRVRSQLLDELATNATDPVVFNRRLRMLRHVNSYESQLVQKIQNFDTDNVKDLVNFDFVSGIKNIVHRSA